jgi:hypothetical protein
MGCNFVWFDTEVPAFRGNLENSMMMEAASFRGTLVPIYQTTRRHAPEYPKIHIIFAVVRSSNLTGVSPLSHEAQTGSGPTQPPIELVQEVLRQDVKREDLKLIILYNLMPKLRIHGVILQLSHTFSFRGA